MKTFKDFINEAGDIPYSGSAFKTYDKITSTAGNSRITNNWYPFKNGNNIQFIWYTNNRGTLFVAKAAPMLKGTIGVGLYKLTPKDTLEFQYPLWNGVDVKDFKSKFKTENDGNKFLSKAYEKVCKMTIKQPVKDVFQKMFDDAK